MSTELGRCPRCAAEVQPGTRYCANCGYDLTTLSPTAEYQQSASWQSAEGAKARIMDTIRRRGQSDEILSEMWVILPVLAVAAILVLGVALVFIVIASGTQIGFGALILAAIGVSLLSLVLFLVLNYKLLKRQHEHIAREAALRRALIDFFKAKGTDSGYNVYQYVQGMEAIDRDAAFNE